MTRLTAVLALASCLAAASAQAQHEQMSNDELAKQLSNPISEIWSLQFQNNLSLLRGNGHSYRGKYALNFQPAMPIHLTDDWNLILRPVFNFTDTPFFDSSGDLDRTSGIGQTSVIGLLSPQKSKLLWGVGPSFIIPTTTRDELSQRKYAVGPAGVVLKMTKKWVVGIFPQYWWSFSGSNRRREVSQANIQYFLWRSLGQGWQVGMSPNISYNSKASGPNAWEVPVGLGVQRTMKFGKLPVKFQLESQYYVVHTEDFGQRWNFRFAITPVIPALIKRNLFGGKKPK
jgi:hypothetical protein